MSPNGVKQGSKRAPQHKDFVKSEKKAAGAGGRRRQQSRSSAAAIGSTAAG
jgi:hypothetical protein